MNGPKGWRIARIHGVDLKIHISLLFLLLYVVVVASAQFPAVVRQSGVDASTLLGGPVSWGGIFSIALLISVVLHEFGHVFTAQSMGVKVRGVTLMMLGGVSEMQKLPETRYAEFKLAIVGPLVSLALGSALLILHEHTSAPELSLFSFWLGRINILLGVFNLLPAFPLDGGRALRSLLASRWGMIRGTQLAVGISKWLAWGLGAVGLFGLNLLLVLIAIFIYTAASSELYLMTSCNLLRDVKAGELAILLKPLTASITLLQAAEAMLQSRNRILPVRAADGTVALISLNELRSIPRERWSDVRVSEIMTPPTLTIDVQDSIGQVLPELAAVPGGAVLVKENGEIIGILRYADLAEVLQLKSLEKAA